MNAVRHLQVDTENDLPDADFKLVSEILYREAGIVVRDHKQAMVKGRLARLARDSGAPSIAAYCQRLRGADAERAIPDLVNALTTNHTSFYREEHHFTHLEQVALPAITAKGPSNGRLRIWCAAASSGEEPYTIAATVHAYLKGNRHPDCLILGTDIDSEVLTTAEAAVYPQSALARLTEAQRSRLLVSPSGASQVRIGSALKDMLRFRRLNILQDWPFKGPFQIIFCRNMLIYFDQPTKLKVIDRLTSMLAIGGYLYLGHSEAMPQNVRGLQICGRTTYQRI